MKKLIVLLAVVFVLLAPCLAYAEPVEALPAAVQQFDDSSFGADMTGILMNADTGEVLYSRNSDQQIYPASTTKIMTGLLAIEMNGGTLDGEITVGAEVNQFDSSSSLMNLKQNHKVSIKDLLYGLMMCSGNDAANALAVHFCGSVDGFVQKMNEKAQVLGMTNTYFANPHGLKMQNQQHYSTAADMAMLARAAHQDPVLMGIMKTPSYTVESTDLDRDSQTLTNGNYLVNTPPSRPEYSKYLYAPATGMKTGLIQNVDGNSWYGCLVASASKDNTNLIAAVFGDTSDRGLLRWDAVADMFDYGFGQFEPVDMSQYIQKATIQEQLSNYASNDPEEGMLAISSGEVSEIPGVMMLDKVQAQGLSDGSITVETRVSLTKPSVAPIAQGEEMGTVTYLLGGEELCSAKLLADRKVYQLGEESETRKEYDLPGIDFQPWWLAIIIPVGIVGALFILRAVNRAKRRRGRGYRDYGYRQRQEYEMREYGTRGRAERPTRTRRYPQDSSNHKRGRRL